MCFYSQTSAVSPHAVFLAYMLIGFLGFSQMAAAAEPDSSDALRIVAGFRKNGAMVIYCDQWNEANDSYYLGPRAPAPDADRDIRDLFIWNATSASRLSDADIADIGRIESLKGLFISHAGITDKGVVAIGRLRSLEHLDLSETSTGDAACAALVQVSSLKTLKLAWTNVSDDGVATLSCLYNLESLDLQGTRITEQCLDFLALMPRLKYVQLGTGVVSGDTELFRRLPQLDGYSLGKLHAIRAKQ